jgi:hypothetical protein
MLLMSAQHSSHKMSDLRRTRVGQPADKVPKDRIPRIVRFIYFAYLSLSSWASSKHCTLISVTLTLIRFGLQTVASTFIFF